MLLHKGSTNVGEGKEEPVWGQLVETEHCLLSPTAHRPHNLGDGSGGRRWWWKWGWGWGRIKKCMAKKLKVIT